MAMMILTLMMVMSTKQSLISSFYVCVCTGSSRQEAVVAAMKHAWKGYKTYAWGHDHLKPISRSRNDWLRLGLTLVDALDTLWIMDLKEGL